MGVFMKPMLNSLHTFTIPGTSFSACVFNIIACGLSSLYWLCNIYGRPYHYGSQCAAKLCAVEYISCHVHEGVMSISNAGMLCVYTQGGT